MSQLYIVDVSHLPNPSSATRDQLFLFSVLAAAISKLHPLPLASMAFTSSAFSATSSSSSSIYLLNQSKFLDSHSISRFSPCNRFWIFLRFRSKVDLQSRRAAGFGSSLKRFILNASNDRLNAVGSTSLKFNQDIDSVPMPIVLIDQDSDSDATIVQVSFGDRLGALIDTMKALREIGLDVAKGIVSTEGSVKQTKFFITRLDTGRKVEDPDILERIRLTIINNLLKYHPESSQQLAMGEAFGIKAPEKKLDVDIATHIHVKEDGPKKSLLCIETADRPGLLVEIIQVIADVNIDVESAEIDTEGLVAKDKFHVSYRGAALNSSLSQVLVNCLRYYLRRPEIDVDSY